MALFDLLGRRWALRVIWELRKETLTFRELQSRCEDMSSSVLNQRLGELRDAGIVTTENGEGYRLSREGQALIDALAPLHGWANRWATAAAHPRVANGDRTPSPSNPLHQAESADLTAARTDSL
jgi:DNA-binding HxlR family transcriptional regulator